MVLKHMHIGLSRKILLLGLLLFISALHGFAQADSTLANSLRKDGKTHFAQEEYPLAIQKMQQAAPIYEQVEDWEKFAYCQLDIGYYYLLLNQQDSSDYFLTKALSLSQQKLAADNGIFIPIFNLLSVVYYHTGDHEKALSTALISLAQGQKANASPSSIVANINNIAYMYEAKSDYGKAQDYFEQALALGQDLTTREDQINIAAVNNGLGNLFSYQKMFRKALVFYQKGVEIHERIGNPNGQISNYNGIGLSYQGLERWDSALFFLEKGERLLENSSVAKEETLANLGFVYLKKGNPEKALPYLNEALALYQKNNPKHPDASKIQRYIGDALVLQGKINEGLNAYQKAFFILSDFKQEDIRTNPDPLIETRSQRDLLKTLHAKAKAFKLLGNNYEKEQLATYKALGILIDQMRQDYLSEASKVFLAEAVSEIYEDAIEFCLLTYEKTKDEKLLELAFTFSEKSRAALVLEGAKDNTAKQIAGVPDTLVTKERQLQLDIAFYKNKYLKAKDKKEPKMANIYQEKAFALDQKLTQLKEELKVAYPTYYRYKYEKKVVSIEEIQQNFLQKNKTALLEYFVGERAIYLFVLTSKGVNYYKTAQSKALTLAFEQLWNGFQNLTESQLSAEEIFAQFTSGSYHLYSKLLAPALTNSPTTIEQLIVIPDGPLSFVPFEALLTKPTENQTINYLDLAYLVNDYQVSYGYSATLLLNNKEAERQNAQPTFLAFAPFNQVGTAEAAVLAYTQQELEGLSAAFKGKALLGAAAQKSEINQKEPPTLLHFATHGLVNHQHPNYSYLVLGGAAEKPTQDKRLYAYEIQNLALGQAQLATLSACETGIGRQAKGEGVMSLARSFMYAGIPTVVMTLWKVNDQSSAAVNRHFYQQLSEGKSKTAAIQAAKLHYLEEVATPATAHPYYWAGYVLLGASQGNLVGGGWPWWGYLLVIMGIGLVAWFVFGGKRTHPPTPFSP